MQRERDFRPAKELSCKESRTFVQREGRTFVQREEDFRPERGELSSRERTLIQREKRDGETGSADDLENMREGHRQSDQHRNCFNERQH